MLCTLWSHAVCGYTQCLGRWHLDQVNTLDGIAVEITDDNELEMWRSDADASAWPIVGY